MRVTSSPFLTVMLSARAISSFRRRHRSETIPGVSQNTASNVRAKRSPVRKAGGLTGFVPRGPSVLGVEHRGPEMAGTDAGHDTGRVPRVLYDVLGNVAEKLGALTIHRDDGDRSAGAPGRMVKIPLRVPSNRPVVPME